MDFATRQYNHSFHIDPIVRSLLDTDFYILTIAQLLWKENFNDMVTIGVTNRTKSVRLAETVDIDELREQLDYVKALRFRPEELIWLTGQTFYGQEGMFEPAFINTLRALRLPDYHLAVTEDGQFALTFAGRAHEVTLWEIYALAILNEMRYRTIMKTMSRSALDILYARAKVKLYDKLTTLNELPALNLTDFGTRRRHGFLWQEHCILTAREVLGDKFTGTSNAYLAMVHGVPAKGTNAHSLPMIYAALAGKDDAKVKAAQFEVLRQWQKMYHDRFHQSDSGSLLVMLPDTFGTTQFLRDAPEWMARWTGARPDSKEPIAGGEELIAYWKHHGVDPTKRLIIFADGLDVALPGEKPNGTDIGSLYRHFDGKVRMGFGFGTNFTNDFRGCHPGDPDAMKPISLVCKVKAANGHGAVKLSDNWQKASGEPEVVERYRRIFGSDGMSDVPALV